MINYNTDEIEEKGFINKEFLLQYVTEEEIFELVFGFKPVEFQYVTSPLRKDNSPGCWFEKDITNGKLKFRDFGHGKRPLDCFDVVQQYYRIPNFYKTLDFIKIHLIDGKKLSKKVADVVFSARKSVEILITTRDFNTRDKRYWEKYQISKQNLMDDKIFPVKKFKLTNTKKGDMTSRVYDICYAYTNFENNRKKLYRPFQKGRNRFLTNCKADDIGEIDNLIPFGRQLVISKSYKDFRVLRNQGINSVWFQNEGMIPSNKILLPLCKRFDTIPVFFDNDKAGIEASIKISGIINSFYPGKSIPIHLPESLYESDITDPSDFIRRYGKIELNKFLKHHNLIL